MKNGESEQIENQVQKQRKKIDSKGSNSNFLNEEPSKK